MSARAVNVKALLRRLDAVAFSQLAAQAALLAEENESLRSQLAWAEDAAESWRDDALRMMEERCAASGERPGITQQGQLVTVRVTA